MKSLKFKPKLIGTATFENGMKFKIEHINLRGACRITDLITNKVSYTRNVINAWANVRYQAKIIHKTERSS